MLISETRIGISPAADGSDIYALHLDGSDLNRLTHGNDYGIDGAASSADSKHIYFTADEIVIGTHCNQKLGWFYAAPSWTTLLSPRRQKSAVLATHRWLFYHAPLQIRRDVMAKSYDVFGVGNALVDILAFVDDQFIVEHKIAKGSMTLVDAQQQAGLLNKLEGEELKLRSGGSAANTMIAIAMSGGNGYYAGKVAKDSHGEFYREDLVEAGIDFQVHPSQQAGPTGTSLILTTPDAERTMCTNLGVSTDLHSDDIQLEPLANSKFVYIEGYLWDGDQPRAASARAMECAKSHGVPVAFTFSDMFLVERFRDDFKRIAHDLCDVVFCNADEIRHFFGLDSLDQCAKELGRLVKTGFITDGPKGCYVIHQGQAEHVAGFPADAVDTVGAGDAFAGGVLYGLTHELDYADAARWGNYVASRVVQVQGARLEDSLIDQVDKFFGR